MTEVRKKLRSWQGQKTFPFKIPNLTSRQDTLGAIEFKDGDSDGDESSEYEHLPALPPGQVGLVFVFVEW